MTAAGKTFTGAMREKYKFRALCVFTRARERRKLKAR